MKPKFLLCLALSLSGIANNSRAQETNEALAKTKITMSLDASGTTNSRVITLETSNSSEGLESSVETNLKNFVLSSTNVASTNTAAEMLSLVKTNIFSTSREVAKAEDFWLALKERGDLPGMSKDSHGNLTTGTLPPSALTCPFAVTFHVVLRGDSFTNHYTIGQAAEGAPWQLQRAWRTDAEGRTIKEWPVK